MSRAPMSPGPRISPVPIDALDEASAGLLPRIVVAGQATSGRSNVMRTLLRHPALFERWTPLLDALLNGRLPARDRELLVLRTAWNCQSVYEWGQHVVVARKVGLSEEEIEGARRGPEDPRWDPSAALLLRAADELCRDVGLSDGTWEALTRHYDEQQLIEIPMVVGHYAMIAMVLNALEVAPDEGLPGFDG